jgi:hypothetical protein
LADVVVLNSESERAERELGIGLKDRFIDLLMAYENPV